MLANGFDILLINWSIEEMTVGNVTQLNSPDDSRKSNITTKKMVCIAETAS